VVELNPEPEQKARVLIDEMLRATGWQVQNYRDIDLGAASAIAVREFPVTSGQIDYLPYVDRKAIGTIEAKKAGETLRGGTLSPRLDSRPPNSGDVAALRHDLLDRHSKPTRELAIQIVRKTGELLVRKKDTAREQLCIAG
jgi:hypothetical protein